MERKRITLLRNFILISGGLFFSTQVVLAADCTESKILPPMTLHFYDNQLNNGLPYTINLEPTLNALSTADSGTPYFKKSWRGACPQGMDGGAHDCIEFTVYPNAINFAPGNIMTEIEKYTGGRPNRGEVRIITDATETHYIYTTDHEHSFCGPYKVIS
ncbi:MAG: hypothetical protein NTZ67_04450 [Gammaproteobacteria bacterium]|nr:hypothetical protein [Gammaproteobacteria bacterium]